MLFWNSWHVEASTKSQKTKGVPLEELGALFGDPIALDFEHALAGRKRLQEQEKGGSETDVGVELVEVMGVAEKRDPKDV